MRGKSAGCLMSLALFLSACSINISDIQSPTKSPVVMAPSPTATPAIQSVPGTALPSTPSAAPPTATLPALLPWAGFHLTGHLVYIQSPGDVVRLDLQSGQTITLFHAPHNAWPTAAAVSPDGQRIVMAYAPPAKDSSQQFGYSELYVLPADGSGTLQVLVKRADPQEAFSFPQWSPDGHYIYYAHAVPDTTGPLRYIHFTYTLERVAYPNGRPQKLLDNAIWPRLSPDGKKLAYVAFDPQSGDNNLYVADVDGKHARPAVPASTFYAVDAPLFSRDSQVIIFSAVGGPASSQRPWTDQPISARNPSVMRHSIPSDWWRVDLASGKFKSLTRMGDTGMYGDFSPDGQHIAFVTSTGLYLMNPDGSNLSQMMNFGPENTVNWIP